MKDKSIFDKPTFRFDYSSGLEIIDQQEEGPKLPQDLQVDGYEVERNEQAGITAIKGKGDSAMFDMVDVLREKYSCRPTFSYERNGETYITWLDNPDVESKVYKELSVLQNAGEIQQLNFYRGRVKPSYVTGEHG